MFASGKAAAVSSEANYIEDVFSTYLYTGNGSTQTITNGIDLAGKGGMVWLKARTSGGSSFTNHAIIDTARGANANGYYSIYPNLTEAQFSPTGSGDAVATAVSATGFTVGGNANVNYNTQTDVSWTFRKQPKFFDVVTYTGNATARTIAHNLGSVPGCIMIKRTDDVSDWTVYHRGVSATIPADYNLVLNSTAARNSSQVFNFTPPTSTEFTIYSSNSVNASGGTYVAYLFAHDAGGFGLTGTDNVISCGSFTTDGSGYIPTVNLGYEPQWILAKPSSGTGNWFIMDNMRGWYNQQADQGNALFPNTSGAEAVGYNAMIPTATGFTGPAVNFGAGITYIYIAIRRGPMKVPTSGTSVFYPNAIAQTDSPDSSNVPFPPDLINTFSRDGTNRTNNFSFFQFVDRLRGAGTPNNTRVAASEGRGLVSSGTDAEYGTTSPFTYVQLKANSQDITRGTGWNSSNYGNWIYYFFRRAPSFFDEVCYTGTGSATTVAHNLGAVPELIIVKIRDAGAGWYVYNKDLTSAGYYLLINSTAAQAFSNGLWNSTQPTSSSFTVGTGSGTNGNGSTYVAYLFATCAGVSKVGSYTGTGTTQTINCGFTGGARFVLIKITNTSGNWFVWDTARGMVVGTDPSLALNDTAAEEPGDSVYTATGGFQLAASPTYPVNSNGYNYIYLAIA